MKLSSLSKLDNEDLSSEWRQLQEKRKYYEKLISNESLRNQEIVKELKEIKAKYGDARKTKLGNDCGDQALTEPINIFSI